MGALEPAPGHLRGRLGSVVAGDSRRERPERRLRRRRRGRAAVPGEPPLGARMRRAGQAGPTRREQRALEPAPVARAKPGAPRAAARVGARRRRRCRDQAARRAGQAGSEGRRETRRRPGPSPGHLARRPASTPSADVGAESGEIAAGYVGPGSRPPVVYAPPSGVLEGTTRPNLFPGRVTRASWVSTTH